MSSTGVKKGQEFSQETVRAAVILHSQEMSGLALDGFTAKVLPVALRIQELRLSGFKGEMVVNIKDGSIRPTEKHLSSLEEYQRKFGVEDEGQETGP